MSFADSLAAGAASRSANSVVLLTNGKTLPRESADYLAKRNENTTLAVAGGPAHAAVMSAGLQIDANAVFVGDDRFETALSVARAFPGTDRRHIVVANGLDFPDALAGAAYASNSNAVLLLTRPSALPEKVSEYLEHPLLGIRATLIGGKNVINASVEKTINDLLTAGN